MADRGRRKKKNNRRRIGPDLLDRDPKSLHPTRRHPTHQTVPFMGRSDRSLVFASPRRVPHIRRHRSIQLIHTSHRIAPCCTTLGTTSGRAGMCIPPHRHAPSIISHPRRGWDIPPLGPVGLQIISEHLDRVLAPLYPAKQVNATRPNFPESHRRVRKNSTLRPGLEPYAP